MGFPVLALATTAAISNLLAPATSHTPLVRDERPTRATAYGMLLRGRRGACGTLLLLLGFSAYGACPGCEVLELFSNGFEVGHCEEGAEGDACDVGREGRPFRVHKEGLAGLALAARADRALRVLGGERNTSVSRSVFAAGRVYPGTAAFGEAREQVLPRKLLFGSDVDLRAPRKSRQKVVDLGEDGWAECKNVGVRDYGVRGQIEAQILDEDKSVDANWRAIQLEDGDFLGRQPSGPLEDGEDSALELPHNVGIAVRSRAPSRSEMARTVWSLSQSICSAETLSVWRTGSWSKVTRCFAHKDGLRAWTVSGKRASTGNSSQMGEHGDATIYGVRSATIHRHDVNSRTSIHDDLRATRSFACVASTVTGKLSSVCEATPIQSSISLAPAWRMTTEVSFDARSRLTVGSCISILLVILSTLLPSVPMFTIEAADGGSTLGG